MKSKINRLLSVEVEGLNQLRLLSALAKEGVVLHDLRFFSPKSMKFCVAKKDIRKTFAILKKMCYNYSVRGLHTAKGVLSMLAKRSGMIVGALLFVAVIAFFQTCVLGVKADIENDMLQREVEQLLTNLVPAFSSKRELDFTKLKTAVCDMDSVADCTVELRGNFVVVSATEKTQESEKLREYTDIVSEFDAVITSVVATKGTSAVKVGDVVKRGDVLISGTVMDATGETVLQTGAIGKVFGEVVIRKSLTLKRETEEFVYTGREQSQTYISFLATPQVQSPYEHYEAVYKSADFSAFLPITYGKIIFREKEKRKIYTDFDGTARLEAQKICLEYGCLGQNYTYNLYAIDSETFVMTISVKFITEIGIGVK